jgi:hypothetical protein
VLVAAVAAMSLGGLAAGMVTAFVQRRRAGAPDQPEARADG